MSVMTLRMVDYSKRAADHSIARDPVYRLAVDSEVAGASYFRQVLVCAEVGRQEILLRTLYSHCQYDPGFHDGVGGGGVRRPRRCLALSIHWQPIPSGKQRSPSARQ